MTTKKGGEGSGTLIFNHYLRTDKLQKKKNCVLYLETKESETATTSETTTEPTETSAVEKKKRGRPRKKAKPTISEAPNIPKRTRGRPRVRSHHHPKHQSYYSHLLPHSLRRKYRRWRSEIQRNQNWIKRFKLQTLQIQKLYRRHQFETFCDIVVIV